MELGYELIKEQRLFRKELVERVGWFIRLRWCFAAAGVVGTLFMGLIEPEGPFWEMIGIFVGVALYNSFFAFVYRGLRSGESHRVPPFTRFAHEQISMDLAALWLLIFFTGGLYSPMSLFAVFHILISGFLLSPLSCHLYAGIMTAAVGLIPILQNLELLGVYPSLFRPAPVGPSMVLDEICFYLVYAATLVTMAWLATSIKIGLRMKGRELLRVSRELENKNSKLTALYETVGFLGRCTDLQLLMDTATRNATKIMGVRSASIKLLDESRSRLRFASTYGLSGDYLAKGAIDIEKSPINRSVLEGACHAVGNILQDNQFQYIEDIEREGIASIMCLPLKVERMIFGVFCVYSDHSDFFTENDIRFFKLMSDLIALAIENLRNQLNKTWFLHKSAHQLRSPLNTVFSMMKTLRLEYLGPLNPKQKEMLLRSEMRVGVLQKTISDLLGLGVRRSGQETVRMVPVDVKTLVDGLISQFQVQAAERQIDLHLESPAPLPKIVADPSMLDDLFINLLSNALKYTRHGGKVRVALDSSNGGTLRCRISDTGIGIPNDHMPQLFSEFSRAPNAKAHTEEGTGLGLVIVKEILDRLKGTIHIDSKEGQGTTVTFFLPMRERN
jgi:signal transduction histidine kinase